MTMPAYFEIVETTPAVEDAQPWHVRVVGGNHEPMLVGENLSSRDDAEAVVLAIARMFVADPYLVATGEPLEWFVYPYSPPMSAPRVRYVDERDGQPSS